MSAAPPVVHAPVNKWVVAASVGFGSIMATIDSSIVNVAMPHIRGSVGATLEEITWLTTGYIIAQVLVMPLTGFLGALFGQKRIYLISLVLFVVGSMLCGVSRSLPALVLSRAIQGLGAGSLQPTQQAILRQTFPPEEQGMAMALFGMVIMVGPAIGPSLGGWITDNYDWPWIFYINVPVGIVSVLMVTRFVHEPPDVVAAMRVRAEKQRANMDWAGIVLMCITVASMQYVLEEGTSKDWFESDLITGMLLLTVVSMAALFIRELSAPVPVINLRLFKDTTFLSASLIGGVMFAVLMGSMFLLPVFMQELLGYNATTSGVTLIPRTVAMMLAMPIVGRLYSRVPPVTLVAGGIVLFILGNVQLSHITLDSGAWDIAGPLFTTGFGFACLIVPLTTAALTNIPRPDLADAAGLSNFVRQIGGSIGITVFATFLSRWGLQGRAAMAANITLLRPEVAARYQATVAQMLARGMDLTQSQAVAMKMLAGKAALQGTVLAFEKSFLFQAVAFVAVFPLLFFLRVERPRVAPKVEVHVE